MPHPPLALVTGATRGIGAEVARQLAQAGHEVIVSGRDATAARARADALVGEGGTATALPLDITDPGSLTALADHLDGRALTTLVNNAAAFADWGESAGAADLDAARSVLETNLFGTWGVIQAALPALRRAPGARIVNVGSGSASHGDVQYGLGTQPGAAAYAVSKAALHALTVKLATELAPEGILVNAVDPGLTATAPGMEAMGARPVADGARSVVWAALLADDGATGTFTRDGAPLPW